MPDRGAGDVPWPDCCGQHQPALLPALPRLHHSHFHRSAVVSQCVRRRWASCTRLSRRSCGAVGPPAAGLPLPRQPAPSFQSPGRRSGVPRGTSMETVWTYQAHPFLTIPTCAFKGHAEHINSLIGSSVCSSRVNMPATANANPSQNFYLSAKPGHGFSRCPVC